MPLPCPSTASAWFTADSTRWSRLEFTRRNCGTSIMQTDNKPEPVPNQPTFGNGKICYVEIPALDINRSASFYKAAFGWHSRTRGDGSLAFDDGVGQVSGTWVLGRKPMTEVGLLIYVMVDSVAGTMDLVT